jgi:hypothetical protein
MCEDAARPGGGRIAQALVGARGRRRSSASQAHSCARTGLLPDPCGRWRVACQQIYRGKEHPGLCVVGTQSLHSDPHCSPIATNNQRCAQGGIARARCRCHRRDTRGQLLGRSTALPRQQESGTGTIMLKLRNDAWVKAARKVSEQLRVDGVHYVRGIPKALVKGRVLVHNHITPHRQIGANGFRAWTQLKTNRLVRCHCDWAGMDLHGLPHYCVKERR